MTKTGVDEYGDVECILAAEGGGCHGTGVLPNRNFFDQVAGYASGL